MTPGQRSDLYACVADAGRRMDGAPWERGPVAATTVHGLLNGLYTYERDRIKALKEIDSAEMPEDIRKRLREILSFEYEMPTT